MRKSILIFILFLFLSSTISFAFASETHKNSAPSLPIPYKSRYTLGEYWDQLTQSNQWKTYAINNKKEAAALELHEKRKIAQQSDFLPVNLTHTYFGNSVLMIIMSLSP